MMACQVFIIHSGEIYLYILKDINTKLYFIKNASVVQSFIIVG